MISPIDDSAFDEDIPPIKKPLKKAKKKKSLQQEKASTSTPKLTSSEQEVTALEKPKEASEKEVLCVSNVSRQTHKTKFHSQRDMRAFMGCADDPPPDADTEARLRATMPQKFLLTATVAGNLIALKKRGHGKATIRKLSKEEYVDLCTGEVKKYNTQGSCRGNNERNIRIRLEACRLLVAYNEPRFASALFITLTFSVGRTPEEGLKKDLENFFRRLRKKLGTRGVNDKRPAAEREKEGHRYATEYMALVELHDSGFIHVHIILFQSIAKFISVDIAKAAWGLGYVYVNSRLKSQDAFGRYLTADSFNEYEDVGYKAAVEHALEKYQAFLRLPRGFRFIRTSRGLGRPPSRTGFVDPNDLPADAQVVSRTFSEHKDKNGRVYKNFRALLRRPAPKYPWKKRKNN